MADAYRPRFVSSAVDPVDRTRVSLSPSDGVVLHVRVGDEFIAYNVEQLRVDGVVAAPGHIIPQWTFVSARLSSKREEFAPLELVGTVERSRPLFSITLTGLSQTDREQLAGVVGVLAEARHERTGVTQIIRAEDAAATGAGHDIAEMEQQLAELRAEASRVAFERDAIKRELEDYRREAVAVIRQLRERLNAAEAAKRTAQRERAALELRGFAEEPLAPDAPRPRSRPFAQPSLSGTRLNSALSAANAMPRGVAGLEILNLHAQGGMAEVYRARGWSADGREYPYAVKRILLEFVKNQEMRAMFIEEARVAVCLEHPSVVRVYDLATAPDGTLFLVMEFLEGFDLEALIEAASTARSRLPLWFAIRVAQEVLEALDYVSERATDRAGRRLRLVHRDISPHNVFICLNGTVKLMDFGVAKTETSDVKTQAGVTKGKLGYMSPEQLNGVDVDPRSDLYNVGILLYEMVTGERLFHGDTTAEFLRAMVRGVVPTFDAALDVPREMSHLTRVALQRERELRPASARLFTQDLQKIARQYGLEAHAGHVIQLLRDLGLAGADL
jgi:hypothetical protein